MGAWDACSAECAVCDTSNLLAWAVKRQKTAMQGHAQFVSDTADQLC